jgi:hypothetical protein
VATGRSRKVIPLNTRTRKVIPSTARRREAINLVKFIDAHGGKLAPFRAYRGQATLASTRAAIRLIGAVALSCLRGLESVHHRGIAGRLPPRRDADILAVDATGHCAGHGLA